MRRRNRYPYPGSLTTIRYPRSTRPAGFTFVEVLFAIVILGVGSIMLAGMLPVAIKQSSDTRNEITGRSVAEAGFAYLQSLGRANPAAFPVTYQTPPTLTGIGLAGANVSPGQFIPLSHSVVDDNGGAAIEPLYPHASLYGSRVFSSDPRFQWLAFYSRLPSSQTARVVVLALRLQNADGVVGTVPIDRYRAETLTNEDINEDNGPFLLTAQVREGGALEPDTIRFDVPAGPGGSVPNAANPGPLDSGAFAIVASHPAPTANDPQRPYRNNGRVFRLAARRTDLEASESGDELIYDLQPGFDLPAASAGVDRLPNTADDEIDGSMNPTDTFPGAPVNNQFDAGPTTSTGTAVQVWVVGRGLRNPGLDYDAANNPYAGLVQDISVLSAEIQLNE